MNKILQIKGMKMFIALNCVFLFVAIIMLGIMYLMLVRDFYIGMIILPPLLLYQFILYKLLVKRGKSLRKL